MKSICVALYINISQSISSSASMSPTETVLEELIYRILTEGRR